VLAALSGPALDAAMWRRLYSAEEAAAAIARCTIVSYGEKLDALGSARITAHPSGYGIGAANWVVQVRVLPRWPSLASSQCHNSCLLNFACVVTPPSMHPSSTLASGVGVSPLHLDVLPCHALIHTHKLVNPLAHATAHVTGLHAAHVYPSVFAWVRAHVHAHAGDG
jgi:hypothetical protein